MHPQRSRSRVLCFIALAACVVLASACEVNPTSPDATITFNPLPPAAACTGVSGNFFATSIIVTEAGTSGRTAIFVGNPALLLGFADGRFTATMSGRDLPPITNVGSFSISGGYVIFGEPPLQPRSSSASFNCQIAGSHLILVNDDALFDFGSGRSSRARVRMTLNRR